MILCDIGNTSYHFLDGQRDFKESVNSFNPTSITKEVYYISVNSAVNEQLRHLENWINLASFIDMDKYYATMGIDRVVASMAVEDGIVIDAGSAITVDVVKDSVFMGGFIYPGVRAMSACYKNISPALDYSFNFSLDLETLPKNSQDAISYGFLKTLHREVISHNLPIILTGGDATFFKEIFPQANINQKLIFDGMKKIISII